MIAMVSENSMAEKVRLKRLHVLAPTQRAKGDRRTDCIRCSGAQLGNAATHHEFFGCAVVQSTHDST